MAMIKITETLGSTVNISGMHLAELTTDELGKPAAYGEIYHVRGSQDIKVNKDQESVANWGDGEKQEEAVSQGDSKVDLQAFALPLELRAWLAGMEVSEDGLVTQYGGVIDPPVVGTIFYKERLNKDVEAIGFTRGTYVVGDDEGKSSEEGKVDFSNHSMSGEFTQRRCDNIKERRRIIKKDDYATLDKFFIEVFSKPAPVTAQPKGWKPRPEIV
ncbi:hypothetical protein ERX35_007845 [Macrococcus equipercicus]|uniref:Phage tail protein n=1 Tax=Macrococcus equipercicus TaxID=69967 RepID=A0ABQ6R7Q0_9STAP|nr:major tail protein [Macrococcus equipercicus]KAA1039119.1 hypothetical protein ERX35_007845 [Macrococcus equipercicus]